MTVNAREVDWDAVVRTYTPRIRRLVARRVADPAAVEDVVQETFIKAYRKWSTFDTTQPLWPWLATIAANLCWWRWQAAQRRADIDVFQQAPLSDYFGEAGSDEHVARLDREAAVQGALRRMTPRHRRILYRWELERRSTTALAITERVSPEVLKAIAVRARRNFREYFLASGEGPFAGVLLGLAGWLNRWRDKATRVATSGTWVEATGALVAAPMVAAAGMAMLAVTPLSTAEPTPAVPVAAQPVVAVHEAAPAVPSPGGPPAAASASMRPTASSPVSNTPPTTAPPLRVGVQPMVGTTNRSASSTIEAGHSDDSNVHTVLWTDVHCDAGFIGRTTCKALDAGGQ